MDKEVEKLSSLTSWLISLQIASLVAMIGGGGYLYVGLRDTKRALAGNMAAEPPREIANWREYVRKHNATQGLPTSTIEVVEFSDFQCPYCKTFSTGTRQEILAKYGDSIRFTFKHFPLEQIHPQAKKAAVAAQCAHRAGKFWELADEVFRTAEEISHDYLLNAGKSIGLGEDYSKCVTSESTLAEVEQDMNDAEILGIRATPSLIVNGVLVTGTVSVRKFETLVHGKLEE